MIRALLLSLVAFPAVADEYRFGGSVLTFDGREVVFTNGPTGREHPADFHRDMTHGLTVRVVIVQELNPQPDTIMVIPPPGYIAVPDTLTVEEYGRGGHCNLSGGDVVTYRQTQCRICLHVYCEEDSDHCPKCVRAHVEASNRRGGGSTGRRIPALNLDMQEGNWSEWN